jgi:hypothetical protein
MVNNHRCSDCLVPVIPARRCGARNTGFCDTREWQNGSAASDPGSQPVLMSEPKSAELLITSELCRLQALIVTVQLGDVPFEMTQRFFQHSDLSIRRHSHHQLWGTAVMTIDLAAFRTNCNID